MYLNNSMADLEEVDEAEAMMEVVAKDLVGEEMEVDLVDLRAEVMLEMAEAKAPET